MIDHVFLPRHLPMDFIHMNSDQLRRVEGGMLSIICETMRAFEEPHNPDVVRDLFDKLRQLHNHTELDPIILSTQFMELRPNGMMGIYVRKANCGLFLKKSPASNEVTMATFQVNLTNEQVYGDNRGDNINGDIQVEHTTAMVASFFSLFLII